MIPKIIIEWSIWVTLDEHKNLELILLKGHLILESMMEDVINNYLSKDAKIKTLHLTYYKKIQLMKLLARDDIKNIDNICAYLTEVNSIRNKLAHNYKFQEENELNKWAERVLSDFPVTKFTKYTFRTKIVHAFAALTMSAYEELNA